MNAISLLSGWSPGNSHAGSSTQQSGAAAAVLDGDHEDGHPLRPLTTGNGQDIGLARGTSSPSTRVFTDNDGQLGARMESASTLEATSAIIEQSPHSESLYDGLLLSEREYESREREAAAAAYPSPPPTPNPDDDGMSVQRAQDKQDSLPSSTYPSAPLILGTRPRAPGDLQHLDALSPDPANKEKYPSDTKHALLQASSDLIARSLPVRCLVRLYTLLRRFFAVFGLRLHTRPVSSRQSLGASHNNNSALTSLSHALLANGMAESPSHPNPPIEQPERPSRWRPRFVGFERRRKPHSPTVAANSEPRESEKGQLYTEKGGSANEVGQRPLAVQSSQSKRTSLAQLAVSRPKTLVLDLDETLIHSTSRLGPGLNNLVTSVDGGRTNYKADVSSLKVRVVEVVLDGRSVVYHVYKRPWVDFFLRKVSKWYTVIIFTASMQEYADPVIDWLDPGHAIFHSRLFRESCTYMNGSYVKDLSIIDNDLGRVCLVDNSPVSFAKHQANGIPIEGWINDPNDEALLDLLPMLDSLRFTNDVRHILGLRLASTSTVLPSASLKVRRPGRDAASPSPLAAAAVSSNVSLDVKVS